MIYNYIYSDIQYITAIGKYIIKHTRHTQAITKHTFFAFFLYCLLHTVGVRKKAVISVMVLLSGRVVRCVCA